MTPPQSAKAKQLNQAIRQKKGYLDQDWRSTLPERALGLDMKAILLTGEDLADTEVQEPHNIDLPERPIDPKKDTHSPLYPVISIIEEVEAQSIGGEYFLG